jgi:hypothetical protein
MFPPKQTGGDFSASAAAVMAARECRCCMTDRGSFMEAFDVSKQPASTELSTTALQLYEVLVY